MLADDELAAHFGEYEQWRDFEGSYGDVRLHQDGSRGPELGSYMFEEENIFKDVPNAFEEGQKTPKQERWGSRFGSRPASRHASRRGSVAAGARTPTSNRDQLADYFERASLQQQGQVVVDDSEDETEDQQ